MKDPAIAHFLLYREGLLALYLKLLSDSTPAIIHGTLIMRTIILLFYFAKLFIAFSCQRHITKCFQKVVNILSNDIINKRYSPRSRLTLDIFYGMCL